VFGLASLGPGAARFKRLLAVTGLFAALLCAFAARQAGAYQIAGKPWPGKRVSYYSIGSRHSKQLVDRAARIWNRANVGVRFVRSPSSAAEIMVSGVAGICRGEAYIGYPGEETSWLYVAHCPTNLMVLVLAHEFGHVLGLGHERVRCARMNIEVNPITGTPGRCRRRPLSYWLKHPLTRDDIRGARTAMGQRER
jgi:hypothetical protein